jgi:hypothetical protein
MEPLESAGRHAERKSGSRADSPPGPPGPLPGPQSPWCCRGTVGTHDEHHMAFSIVAPLSPQGPNRPRCFPGSQLQPKLRAAQFGRVGRTGADGADHTERYTDTLPPPNGPFPSF